MMFWPVIFCVCFVLAIYVSLQKAAGRRDRLGEAALTLGAEYHRDSSSIRGVMNGVSYDYKFVTRGSGSSAESWTELEVALAPGYPFALRFEDHRRHDEVVDVEVGSPEFDNRFLLEGAPATVVAKLFTPIDQRWLLQFAKRAIEIQTKAGRTGEVLMIAMRGWTEDVAEIRERCEIAVAMAGRVRELHRALDQGAAQLVLANADAPYRPLPSEAPLELSRQERDNEVTALVAAQQQRNLRRAAAQRSVLIVLMAIVVIAAAVATFVSLT